MKLELKGWAAVPAVILVLAFIVYRTLAAHTALAEEPGQLIKLHLQGVYSGKALPGLESAIQSGSDEATARAVKGITDLEKIEFVGVGIKGTGKKVIARVEIRVAGQTPPDGKNVRYFQLEHSVITGWRVVREVTAFSYYSKLF